MIVGPALGEAAMATLGAGADAGRKGRRGSRFVSPMPMRLGVDAVLRVSDQAGRLVRQEPLPAGTDLHARLRLAHGNTARQCE